MTDHRDITPEEEALLRQALQNLGAYITEHGQPQYVLINDNDPRNEDDYSTWDYGTEPLPHDHTWRSTSIDVSPSSLD
tara:strand:- start:3624 stop:3857 length:234 start_codon:yes stop_codon:yes gene_type:complete